jgi:hypothetical protein
MSINNSTDLFSKINFIEKHVGGNLDDTLEEFKNQKNIIDENTNDYNRLLDYYNKLKKEKDDNDNYIQRLDVETTTNPYRLNTLPTTIDGINYSNPIVFSKQYDEYFEYIAKKNLAGLNTKIILKKFFVNVDSANRDSAVTLNVDNYLKLQPNTMVFKNGSNTFKILVNDASKKYIQGQKISLRGYKAYTMYYQSLNFYFVDGKSYVVLDIKPNFDNTIPYYDIIISISGVINGTSTYFKNIPLSIINQSHKVDISNYNSDYRLQFEIPLTFYSDNSLNQTLVSDCEITYYSLGNYPLSLINANAPLTEYNLVSYHIISTVTDNYIELKLLHDISINKNIILTGEWINDEFYTGQNIEISTITSFNVAYPTPTSFTINLDKSLNNVASIKVISSEIPNVQKNIRSIKDYKLKSSSTSSELVVSSVNNKLYWDNLLDNVQYSIELPTSYYTFSQLQDVISEYVGKVPRINKDPNLVKLNNMEVILDESSNIASFKSWNYYTLPNCLIFSNKLETIDPNSNKYLIRISHPNHNLQTGDTIYISGSIDYYYIDKNYINEKHIIYNVLNNNFYEIILSNINLIPDVGDTKGGYSIVIKTPNSFRLRFDNSDTFGKIIGFRFVGNPTSVTKYCNILNNYVVNNLEPYVYDITKILVTNNTIYPSQVFYDFNNTQYPYILLQCTNFNLNTNPNGPPFFYKFLMGGLANTVIYNSFVVTPIYLNPPIRAVSNLQFNFIDPTGNPINFYNRNWSLTLQIDYIDNAPENTNISTYVARI